MTRETQHDTPFFRLMRWGSRWSLRWGVLWVLGFASLSVFIPGLNTGVDSLPDTTGPDSPPRATVRIGGQGHNALASRHSLEALAPGALFLQTGEMRRYEQNGRVLHFYFETFQTSFDPLVPSAPSQWTAGKTRAHYQENPATDQEGDLFISSEWMAAQDSMLILTGATEVQLRIPNASTASASQSAMLREFLEPARPSEETGGTGETGKTGEIGTRGTALIGTLVGTHLEYHVQDQILWALGPVLVTTPGHRLRAEDGLQAKPQAGGVLQTLGTTRLSGPEMDLRAREGLLLRTGTGETEEKTSPQGPGLLAARGLLIQMQGLSTVCFGRGVYPDSEEDNADARNARIQQKKAPGCYRTRSQIDSPSQAAFLTAQNALKLEADQGVFYDRNKREIVTSGPTVLETGPYRLQAGALRLTHSGEPDGVDGVEGLNETEGVSVETGFLYGGVRLESESMTMTTPQMEISFPDSHLLLAAGGTEIFMQGSRFWTPDSVSFDGQKALLWFPGRVTFEHDVYQLTGRAAAVTWQPQATTATGAQNSTFALPEPSQLLELRMAGPVGLEGPDLSLKGQELKMDFKKNEVELCGGVEAFYHTQHLSGTCLVYDFSSRGLQISEQVKGLFFLD